MNSPRHFLASLVAKAMMLCLFGPLSDASGTVNSELPRMAIIPLANYTNSLKAHDQVTKLLRASLTEMGFDLVDNDSLRAGMRANRLRLVGEIDSAGAEQIALQTGAEILITGSLDLYLEQVNPEVSISLRAYDCRTHKMVWIECLSTTGEDQAGLFGIGRLTDLEQLTNKAVKTVLKRMPRFSGQEQKPVRKPSKNDLRLIQQGRIAIVRFDNSTDVPNADAAVTNAMIQEAWQRGYDVVEPGELSRIRTRLASDFQGGIGDSALAILRDEFNVAIVVTGMVTRFLPNRGASIEAVPEIEFTIRSIDPADGEVRSSLSLERDGAARETVFGYGRESAIGEVARQAIKNGWDELITGWFKKVPAVSKSTMDGDQNAEK